MAYQENAEFDKTKLSAVGRNPNRGHYDKDNIRKIVAECKIAHVAWTDESSGLPQCIPMIAALEEVGDDVFLYFHGYPAGRLMKSLSEHGTRLVATLTLLDGYVMALSHFNSSMNYRSACLHGSSMPFGALEHEKGKEEALKMRAFELIVEAIARDRWNNARLPIDSEIKGTEIIRMHVETASAKIREGGPKDPKEDMDNKELVAKTWTGHIPVGIQHGEPIPSTYNSVDVPRHVLDMQ